MINIIMLLMKTILIYNFMAVTFSVKLGIVYENFSSVKAVICCDFLQFGFFLKIFYLAAINYFYQKQDSH